VGKITKKEYIVIIRHTMSVIKAKSVDTTKINISSPKSIVDGKSYTFNLTYDSNALIIQLPRCQLFTGVYESDGKCYCEIAIPTKGVTSEMYFNIAARLEDLLKGERRYENVSFLGHMRKVIDDFSCLRLKMPQNKSKVITEIVEIKEGLEVPVSIGKFIKGSTIIPIVTIEHSYMIKETLGFNILLKKVVIVD
tara:strand:+ start:172 stop:753 length:582 start_codon:yes stop_codon:yes gene_type:complete